MLLASWTTVYSALLLGFAILKRLEGVAQKSKAANGTASRTA
jgi:hypothetical protein